MEQTTEKSIVTVNMTITNITANVTLTRNEDLAQVEIIVQSVIFILAVLGNSSVLISLYNVRKSLTRMHLLMIHLSLADLFVAFGSVLPQLAWDISFVFQGGDVVCKLVKYMQIVAIYASSYVLVMTAIDRYLAICYPLVSRKWSSKMVHKMVAVAWTLSVIFSVPQTFIFSYKLNHYGYYDCWGTFNPEWTLPVYITTITVLVYIIPTIILVFCYGSICVVVWKSGKIGERLTRFSKRIRSFEFSDRTKSVVIDSPEERHFSNMGNDSISESNQDVNGTRDTDHELGSYADNNCRIIKELHTELESSSPLTNTTMSKLLPNNTTTMPETNLTQYTCKNGMNNNSTFKKCVLRNENSKNNTNYKSRPTFILLNIKKKTHWKNRQSSNIPKKSTKSSQNTSSKSRDVGHHGISRGKLRTIKLTLMVVICYLVCWSPFFIAQMWAVYDKNAPFDGAPYVIILLLASLNSCTNPWIYLIFSQSMCQQVRKCIRP